MKPAVTKKKPGSEPKSKTFLKYEKLLETIEKQQQFNQNLKDGLDKAYQKMSEVLEPLQKQKNLLICDLLFRLDALATEIGVGKYNREWFEAYMADQLSLSVGYFGHGNEKLAALYKKYNGDEAVIDEEDEMLARSISEMLGFEVDPKEIYELGEEAFFEKYKKQIKDSLHEKSAGRLEDEPADNQSAKSDAKKEKKSSDEGLIRDARSIYMRLIKKFHPDHELDPELREQKTEIVKQVTRAYQDENFFELLKLQITYLDDNETEAERIADDMLKRYNKILAKQLKKLTDWVNEAHFAGGDLVDFIDKNGKFSGPKFAAQRKAAEETISMLKYDLADSKKRPKTWFKEHLSMIKDHVQQSMVQDMLNDMFDY